VNLGKGAVDIGKGVVDVTKKGIEYVGEKGSIVLEKAKNKMDEVTDAATDLYDDGKEYALE
jgi:hypothetical protein